MSTWNDWTGPIDPDATGTDETDDWPADWPEGDDQDEQDNPVRH